VIKISIQPSLHSEFTAISCVKTSLLKIIFGQTINPTISVDKANNSALL
jgi:hypothetical protein